MDFKALKKKEEFFTGLERFDSPQFCNEVSFHSDELTSKCPITGQPDFNSINIKYKPKKFCVESKSLKLYLMTFRDQGLFGESLAEKIALDFSKAIEPEYVEVTLYQHIRGGLQMTVICKI